MFSSSTLLLRKLPLPMLRITPPLSVLSIRCSMTRTIGLPRLSYEMVPACTRSLITSSSSTMIIRKHTTNSLDNSERSMDAVSKEIWTIPNLITMSRIIASPGLTYAIACDMKGVALGGCILFGFSDWLDGYIAKRFHMKSVLGAFLDPLADKIFIGALTVGLTVKGLFPLALAITILGRDVVLVGGSFVIRAMERPSGAPFFDTTNSATFQIVASDLSKYNTVCQIALLVLSLSNFAFDMAMIPIVTEPLYWITAVTTVGSGLGYLDGTGIKRLGKSGEYRNISKIMDVDVPTKG